MMMFQKNLRYYRLKNSLTKKALTEKKRINHDDNYELHISSFLFLMGLR